MTNYQKLNKSVNQIIHGHHGTDITFQDNLFHGEIIEEFWSGQHYRTKLTFNNCKFTGRFEIHGYEDISFVDCEFEDLLIEGLKGARSLTSLISIKNKKKSKINMFEFSGAIFVEIENYDLNILAVDSKKSVFEGLYILNSKIDVFATASMQDKVRYKENAFEGLTKMDQVTFALCEFNLITGFNLLSFGQKIEFDSCKFKNISGYSHSTFRHLKSVSLAVHNEFLSNMFAGYELKSKFKMSEKIEGSAEYLLNVSYEFLNDFGLDRYRPLSHLINFSMLVSLINYVISLAIYFFQNMTIEGFDWCNGLGLLLHNFFVLFSGPFRLLVDGFKLEFVTYLGNPVLRLLLTAISGLLWFFLILGIRKRFKID